MPTTEFEIDTCGNPIIINKGDRIVATFPFETDEEAEEAERLARVLIQSSSNTNERGDRP